MDCQNHWLYLPCVVRGTSRVKLDTLARKAIHSPLLQFLPWEGPGSSVRNFKNCSVYRTNISKANLVPRCASTTRLTHKYVYFILSITKGEMNWNKGLIVWLTVESISPGTPGRFPIESCNNKQVINKELKAHLDALSDLLIFSSTVWNTDNIITTLE